MATIQLQVFTEVAKHKKGVSRKQLQEFIWNAQGHYKPFKHRNGYYGTNIADWEYYGLLVRKERGANFKIGKNGLKYIQDPGAITVIRLKKRIEVLENGREFLIRSRREEERRAERYLDELNEIAKAVDLLATVRTRRLEGNL